MPIPAPAFFKPRPALALPSPVPRSRHGPRLTNPCPFAVRSMVCAPRHSQFLPQDKVVEFANVRSFVCLGAFFAAPAWPLTLLSAAHWAPDQMTSAQVLKETEKAAGDDRMFDQHMELINMRRDEGQAKAKLERERLQVNALEQRARVLEPQVQRFREREGQLHKVRRWAV